MAVRRGRWVRRIALASAGVVMVGCSGGGDDAPDAIEAATTATTMTPDPSDVTTTDDSTTDDSTTDDSTTDDSLDEVEVATSPPATVTGESTSTTVAPTTSSPDGVATTTSDLTTVATTTPTPSTATPPVSTSPPNTIAPGDVPNADLLADADAVAVQTLGDADDWVFESEFWLGVADGGDRFGRGVIGELEVDGTEWTIIVVEWQDAAAASSVFANELAGPGTALDDDPPMLLSTSLEGVPSGLGVVGRHSVIVGSSDAVSGDAVESMLRRQVGVLPP